MGETTEMRHRRYSKRKSLGLCPHCGKHPPVEGREFCRTCLDIYSKWQRAYYKSNPQSCKASSKKLRQALRMAVLAAYGGTCECCGTSVQDFLTIDHIQGGGRQHKIALGISKGMAFYRWLIKSNFPPEFRVLCWNCNRAAYLNGGNCPYHTEVSNA